MSTLGKVLTFLNVLVAIILLVVAGLDYAEWRSLQYAAFRYELVANGLPVDETEINPERPDEPIVKKLPSGVLTEVFKGAEAQQHELGGPAVKTVMEEIDRVQKKVRDNFTSAPPAEQKTKLRSYLLMQARDVAERDRYKDMIEKGAVGLALGELDKRFNDVKYLHGQKGGRMVRYAAAEVLVNLSFDDAWLERVRVVLGIDALTHGLEQASHTMAMLAADVKKAIVIDQGEFTSEYADWVRRLMYETENLYQANKKLTEIKKVVAERQMEVGLRTTEVERNTTELQELTKATNTELDKLKAIENDLFMIQQRLGKARDATYKLDEQLREKAGQRK